MKSFLAVHKMFRENISWILLNEKFLKPNNNRSKI